MQNTKHKSGKVKRRRNVKTKRKGTVKRVAGRSTKSKVLVEFPREFNLLDKVVWRSSHHADIAPGQKGIIVAYHGTGYEVTTHGTRKGINEGKPELFTVWAESHHLIKDVTP